MDGFTETGIALGTAEMVTYLPISSPFIRFAGRYVDDAFGVAAGYNFFIFEAIMVPFEITACNMIIKYWTDKIPIAAIIVITLALYLFVFWQLVGDFSFPNMRIIGFSMCSPCNGMENPNFGLLWGKLCSVLG